jgi:hypothetical protein
MAFAVCGGFFCVEKIKNFSGFRFVLGRDFIVSITGGENAYGKYDF